MISVFYVTYFYLGPDYGFQIYFTIFSVFPFVYFSSEQTLLRLFYAFLNLSCYFFLEIGRYNYVFAQDYKYYNSSIASMYKHMNIIIGFTAIVLVMYMYEYIIIKDEKALKIALENARYHAEYDYLTDTLNRRILSEYIREHMTEELSVIMWDVDDFKKINDVYGHAVGDQVLISLCNLVKKEITRECKFSRWGGEEFLILVEDISYNRVLDIAEKIRREISESQIIEGHKVTISIGVTKKRRDDSFKTLLSRVDDLMYQAEKNGKNIVIESC